MAKRADSLYRSGERTADWLKIKTAKRQEVVIAGFTAPKRSRPYFGALVLALRDGKAWRYIGHVGAGFSHAALEELHGKLLPLQTAKSPFAGRVKDEAVTTWVKPKLVAEVKFTEWTSAGEMRHPVYPRPARGQARRGRHPRSGKTARQKMSRALIIFGIVLIAIGLLWPVISKLGLGRLPGDIVIERENFRLYVPIVTSLIISVVLSLLLWLFNR